MGKRRLVSHVPTPARVPLKSWAAFLPLASAKLIGNYQKSIKPSLSWGRKLSKPRVRSCISFTPH